MSLVSSPRDLRARVCVRVFLCARVLLHSSRQLGDSRLTHSGGPVFVVIAAHV